MDKTKKALIPLTPLLDDVATDLSKTQATLHDCFLHLDSCKYDLTHTFDMKTDTSKEVPMPADAARIIAYCEQVITDGLATIKDMKDAIASATTMIDGIVPATVMRTGQPQAK